MRHLAGLMMSAVATASLMVGLSGTAEAGQFDGVTVKLATFGGVWRDVVDKYVGKAFAAEGGKLEYELGQPAQNQAKLIAARGQEAPFDVLETLDNFLPGLVAGGYTDAIDLSKVPNTADLSPSMYDTGKVVVWTTEEGIVYNKKKFAEAGLPAPKAYADLAAAGLKGKVSLPDISAGGAMPAIVGMAKETGGSEANIALALDLVMKIAPANFWSSSSNLQTGLAGGDIWAAAAQAGNVQRLKDQVDLGMVFPPVGDKTGVLKQGYLVKIKGTKQSAAVDWIINAFLAMPMQIATLTEGGQVPVNGKALAQLHGDSSLSFMRLSSEGLDGMYRIDFSKVNEASYVQQWNRKVGH